MNDPRSPNEQNEPEPKAAQPRDPHTHPADAEPPAVPAVEVGVRVGSQSTTVRTNGASVPAQADSERLTSSRSAEAPRSMAGARSEAGTKPAGTGRPGAKPELEGVGSPKSPTRTPRGGADSHAGPTVPFTEHLSEDVAGAGAYLLGWVSGVIFLLVDRRPFVRYHAAQAVTVFATLSVIFLILGDFFLGTFVTGAGGVLLILRRVVELTWLVATVVLMLKAASGERFRVPYASDIADRAAKSPRDRFAGAGEHAKDAPAHRQP
jgi:uncharacterized membrane protein